MKTTKKVSLETVEKAYRRYARYYDLVFGTVFHPGRATAIEHLHCAKGDRILEVGVGTGLSLPLYPPDVKVVGIDLSEPMLRQARAKVQLEALNNIEGLIKMDAQKMDFPDNSFDKVTAMYIVSVVPDVGLLMNEIRRVCKPGGQIVVLNHFQNRNVVVRNMEAFLQPLAKYLGFHPYFPMEEFLEKTDFQVTTAIPVNFLDYWTVLVGKNTKTK